MAEAAPESANIRERIRSLPIVGSDAPLVPRRKAQAIIHDLSAIDPTIGERVHEQVEVVVDELHGELDTSQTGEGYHLSEDQLRGVVARAALRGAAQVASDLGGTIAEIREMEQFLQVQHDPDSGTI